MLAAADGLLAAGLDPAHDRVMNLLYGGNLYGGMLSFYTILDKLGVPQYPMGGPVDDDFSQIAHFIVSQGVNTLVGMPGTLQRLFECEEAALPTAACASCSAAANTSVTANASSWPALAWS